MNPPALGPVYRPLRVAVASPVFASRSFGFVVAGSIRFTKEVLESLRAPDAEEWRQFSQTLELRDMGTHLCALPAREHCSRGLVCLGCSSAQPKRSATPIFQRMLASHDKALPRARNAGEPAGQLAARELELQRLSSALRRAGDLDDDVAAAIEVA